MNEVTSRWLFPMMDRGAPQKARPISLLISLASSAANGSFQVSSQTMSWVIYLEDGKITYASHSVDPFDRLDLHLRRHSQKITTLVSAVRQEVKNLFGSSAEAFGKRDYEAICWLVNQRYLNPVEAADLIQGLVQEVFESLLLLPEAICEFKDNPDDLPKFCRLDLPPIIDFCRRRLLSWQMLGPQICSPYQRPYLFSQTQSQQKLSPEVQQKLGAILKGFSFRHLAVALNQDELRIAQGLRQYILDGTVLLREPHPPFDRLPRIPPRTQAPPPPPPPLVTENSLTMPAPSSPPMPAMPSSIPPIPRGKDIYKIACIDDSPTILNEMRRFLDDESFSVSSINDPLKALIQVIRLKPDLILLDIGMPSIDGYKLCRLLRNHSLFTTTPIIMVTGNTGIIDRAKAKFVGASDYLTKPFTKSELLKVVFRHLS